MSDWDDLQAMSDAEASEDARREAREQKRQQTLDKELWRAAQDGNHRRVAELVEKGANPKSVSLGSRAATPLMAAARAGSHKVVRALAPISDLDATDNSGATALMHAASAGRAEAISELLAAGASPFAVDRAGQNALHMAARPCHEAALRLLAPICDIDQRDRDGHTAEELAARKPWSPAAGILPEERARRERAALLSEAEGAEAAARAGEPGATRKTLAL
jgi:hypothetical protein